MIDYKEVSKSLAYLIETMNGFDDEVLKYKYGKFLVNYKNYIENYAKEMSVNKLIALMLRAKINQSHFDYLYFPHLEEEDDIVVDDTVDIETVSQLQMDLLVRAGMDATTEPIEQGDIVTFRVTPEVGQEYHTLLAFAIDEYKDIIAQNDQNE